MTRTMHGTVNAGPSNSMKTPVWLKANTWKSPSSSLKSSDRGVKGYVVVPGRFPGSGLRKMTGFSSRSMRKGSGIRAGTYLNEFLLIRIRAWLTSAP